MLKLYTSEPILKDREKSRKNLSDFWDKASAPWKNAVGSHIHVGYYDNSLDISPVEAQDLLVDKLTRFAEVGKNQQILDVGCGMGATSIFLAQRFNAQVNGVTLSTEQVAIAQKKAIEAGVVNQVDFRIEDAHHLHSFADGTFDIVWSLESCEQFYDKPLFLRQAYRVLKPGGKLMLATWCSVKEEFTGREAREYNRICKAMEVPYMPTISYYVKALQAAGFQVLKHEDWSAKVEKTWNLWSQVIRKYALSLLWNHGPKIFWAAQEMRSLQQGFENKRFCYGVFLSQKL